MNSPNILESFEQLSISIPPVLPEMLGIQDNIANYIGVYHDWGKAYWSDGRISQTFNFYLCWEPFSKHPAILFPVIRITSNPCCLGTDESAPTHLLILDLKQAKIYVAPEKEGKIFLSQQHSPLEELSDAEKEGIESRVRTMLKLSLVPENFLGRGMFEFFLRDTPELLRKRDALVNFLDRNIDQDTAELLERFRPYF